MDYKLKLHPATDAGNKEFLKDSSAFANTVGGYLIRGVDEKEVIPTSIRGCGKRTMKRIPIVGLIFKF